MNIGTITTAGPKGQIVIPYKMREFLGISESTPLQISLAGNGITIRPVTAILTDTNGNDAYMELLKRTKGSWADDPDEYQAYRKREKANAKKMQNAW